MVTTADFNPARAQLSLAKAGDRDPEYDHSISFVLDYYTLAVTSTPVSGAAIYKDGVATGQVTPYTFDPGTAGVYSVSKAGWTWTPATQTVPVPTQNTAVSFTGALQPPTGLAATVVSAAQINLGWTDNTTQESGFKIERKIGAGGTWSQITTVGANVTSYNNTGLSQNTSYYYRVRAYYSSTNSAYSNEANATTPYATPAAPSVLTATALSSSLISLSWTDNSDNETGFKIERKIGAGGSWAQIITPPANSNSTTNVGLTQNTAYYYRIRATNVNVDSPYSNEATATTLYSTPTVPQALAATVISSAQINLSWTDNSALETGFKLERKTGAGGTWAEIASLDANVSSYNNTGLSQNTSYYYRIRAFNVNAYSDYSNEASATTLYTTPSAPTALTAAVVSPSQVNLAWTDNSTVETGYKIERKTGSGGTWSEIATVAANVTAYNNSGKDHGYTYYYRVRAYNVSVNSPYSNEASATPVAPPVLSFSANATEVLELVSLQFTDSSTPGSGTISAWLWNFGDGSSSTLQNPSHAYQSAGLYSVSLTVTNSFNASSSLTRTDYIHILLRVPEIALVPGNTVDFGATYMGTQGVQSLLVKNIGSAVLTLQSVSLALSGTPFELQDRAYPLQLDAGDSTYIQLQFTPPYPGSYSNILNLVNNSVNQPQTSLILTGTGVLAAPLAPQNLSFSCSGSNAILTWNAVTQTVADTPVVPDYYFIYRSSLPEGPYTVFGLSTGLSYELPIAGLEEGCMFYHVSALKFYAKNLQPADLDASVQSRIRPGMTEAEVGQVIREIEGF